MELPWADDETHAFLGEALSLLADEWDDSAPLPPAVAAGSNIDASRVAPKKRERVMDSAPPAHETVPRRPVKINLSRERQKQEIRALTENVVQLEDEVTRLQLRGYKRPRLPTAPTASSPSDPPSGAAATGAMVVWEHAARRQFRSRRQAEIVNARLRAMLSTQRTVAEDLIRVIQRAQHAQQEAQALAIWPVQVPSPTRVVDNFAVNDQQLQLRLLKISAEWHVPFAKCDKFHNRVGRPRELFFYDVATTYDDRDELVLEFRASSPSTFPLQAVEDVLWRYFLTLRCTEDDFSLATESRESVDTLVGSLRASASHDGIHGVLDSRFMKQRFRNAANELVIATALNGRPDLRPTTSDTHSSGVAHEQQLSKIDAVLFEDAWLRVFRVDDPNDALSPSSLSTSSGITVIQHVRRCRIRFVGADRPDRAQVRAVEKFMTRLAKNELRWGQEVLERSLILDQKNLLIQ